MYSKSGKILHFSLWTVRLLLTASFCWAGGMKLFQSGEKLAIMWPWTAEHPSLVWLTGLTDLAVGAGILLSGFIPRLTRYVAIAAIALMMAAAAFHVCRGEAGQIGVNLIFAALALVLVLFRPQATEGR